MTIELQMHTAMQAAMKQDMKYDFDQEIFSPPPLIVRRFLGNTGSLRG
jgi:hypothetical protein